MGDAAITFLLDNMADLVMYHVDLISGAEDELQSLKDELMEMRTLLEDASKKRYKEEHFKQWERKLRSAVYEAEDVIDTCITQAAKAKNKNPILRPFTTKTINLAGKVRTLREGKVKNVLDMVTTLRANLNIVDESDRIVDNNMIYRNKPPREENVVGFEDETKTLIGYLLEKSEGLDVVTIVGMPGLGKTTVAWKIYKHDDIKYNFPICIWVVVSNEFKKREVLLTILKKFSNTDTISELVSDDDLEKKVKGYLERSKFLLFLDDVWTTDVWDEILKFLPKNNSLGRILITTRNEIVNQHAKHIRAPHKLRFLTYEESWKLLRLEVFDDLENFPKELEKYGRIISKNCSGLPLAIIVIGGILVKRSIASEDIRRSEWELISKNTDIYINREDSNKSMEKMILLSYNNLPYDLRDCFLYVGGMFPEDSEISAWELIQLWIAEGFIKQSSSGKSLEATAHDHLKGLINTNLVMVDKIKPNGDVKTCRVHDTIREFCKIEAGYDKENLFQEVKMADDGTFAFNEECRRLSVHSHVKEFFLKKVKATKLHRTRSFQSFTKPISLESSETPTFIDVFELLRIFNVKTIKFAKFPTKFTKLVHLRYLTLSVHDFNMLPKAISKLRNLQTLMVVDTQSSTLEFHANIWHMVQLRHVKTKASIVLTGKDMQGDGGENLQTLDKLSPESCTKEVFEKAPNLSTLGIRGDLTIIADSTCLEQLRRLEKLKLVNHVTRKVAAENPLTSLPRKFPGSLKILTLANTYLDWEHMSIVGNIPSLEVLKLKENACGGDCWDSVAGGFLNLEYLYITRSSLQLWRIIDGDPFPRLKTLVLKTCLKLQLVPKDLVMKLNKLEMHRVTDFAVKSAREVYEERKKIEDTQMVKRGGFKLIIGPGDDQNK